MHSVHIFRSELGQSLSLCKNDFLVLLNLVTLMHLTSLIFFLSETHKNPPNSTKGSKNHIFLPFFVFIFLLLYVAKIFLSSLKLLTIILPYINLPLSAFEPP